MLKRALEDQGQATAQRREGGPLGSPYGLTQGSRARFVHTSHACENAFYRKTGDTPTAAGQEALKAGKKLASIVGYRSEIVKRFFSA